MLLKMMWAYKISGFRFYFYSGLLFGLPFIIWSIVFYYFPQYVIILFIFVLITTRIGQEWGIEQEEKASNEGSIQWKEYQKKYPNKVVLEEYYCNRLGIIEEYTFTAPNPRLQPTWPSARW